MGFKFENSGFRVEGLGFRDQGEKSNLGLPHQFGVGTLDLMFGVEGAGFGVENLWSRLRIEGVRLWD